jgi:hypothetical protein
MIERIRLWWKFEGKYYHKYFIYGIKNLWKWLPVIWKDRDWDQNYIYTILKTKLEFQAKYISDRDWHTEAKRDAERMHLVVRLIERQQDDFYKTEHIDYHEVEFEFIPTDETKQWFEMKDTMLSENYDEYFAKYPRQYKRVLNGKDTLSQYLEKDEVIDPTDKRKIAMFIAHENQERSRKLLFKIMEQNIERWWD